MEYNSDERLVNGAEFPESDDCNFEISLIESENSDLEKEEIEAKYIADKIHDMINSGFRVKDGDIMREAHYGDFAIILRSPSGKAATYVNTLNNSGIPAYSENKSSFFDAVEIKIMLNLLRVIDNPGLIFRFCRFCAVLCMRSLPMSLPKCVVKAENLRFTLLSANMRKQTIRQENLLMNLKFCVIVPVQIPLTLSFQRRVK